MGSAFVENGLRHSVGWAKVGLSYINGTNLSICQNYKSFVRPGYHCLSIVIDRATPGYHCLRTGYLLFQNGLRRATKIWLYQIRAKISYLLQVVVARGSPVCNNR